MTMKSLGSRWVVSYRTGLFYEEVSYRRNHDVNLATSVSAGLIAALTEANRYKRLAK